MDEQLQQLIELQREQNQLLKRHLVRLRFSLATLLVLTTVACLALGYVSYRMRGAIYPVPAPRTLGPAPPTPLSFNSPPVVPAQPIEGGPQPIQGGPQPPVYTPPDRYGGLPMMPLVKYT